MKLQIGRTYRDGRGRTHQVQGPTREHPHWVWALSGFWYEQATGHRIDYRQLKRDCAACGGQGWLESKPTPATCDYCNDGKVLEWTHIPHSAGHPDNLVEEIPE